MDTHKKHMFVTFSFLDYTITSVGSFRVHPRSKWICSLQVGAYYGQWVSTGACVPRCIGRQPKPVGRGRRATWAAWRLRLPGWRKRTRSWGPGCNVSRTPTACSEKGLMADIPHTPLRKISRMCLSYHPHDQTTVCPHSFLCDLFIDNLQGKKTLLGRNIKTEMGFLFYCAFFSWPMQCMI